MVSLRAVQRQLFRRRRLPSAIRVQSSPTPGAHQQHGIAVDEAMHVQLTMADREFGLLQGGQILEISPAKVPRLLGRQGSMISLIRDFARVRMFVGQNGRIWLDGGPDDVAHAVHVIHMIEDYAPLTGLTDTVLEYLESAYGRPATGPTERD